MQRGRDRAQHRIPTYGKIRQSPAAKQPTDTTRVYGPLLHCSKHQRKVIAISAGVEPALPSVCTQRASFNLSLPRKIHLHLCIKSIEAYNLISVVRAILKYH